MPKYEQGDIIKLDFNPTKGHEQQGYRPALVVSNSTFNEKTNMAIVCPITNTDNRFPLHVPLDARTKTTGVVLCEHVRAMDINGRNAIVFEKLPTDILETVVAILHAEVEQETP